MPVLTDSRVKVAQDLRVIESLGRRAEVGKPDRLLTQAVHLADDPLMPGGLAMVALADAASQRRYADLLDEAERAAIEAGVNLPEVADDDEWEPPLQTLRFWSEVWRAEHGMDYEGFRPTVATEAAFIRHVLEWAWANEPHWDDFARDITKARGRLESVLADGFRPSMRGVSCMYDECRGARLIRTTVAKTDKKTGAKTWVLTDWHCPECERTWTEDEYQRHVYAAIHREKTLVVTDGERTEVWCTVELAAKRVGRPESTVRVWLHREQVAEVCVLGRDRWRFVLLADVEERDQLARERWARRVAAMKAKRGGQEDFNDVRDTA